VPLWNDLVSANLQPYTSPEEPVEGTSEKHTDTNDGENEVRIPIRILHTIRRDEGHNGQEGMTGGRPVLSLLVPEIDETSSDEPVDPCAGVGVEEEGSSGGIKRFDGGPETAEGEKTLLTELLVEMGVYKTDRKHISHVTEGDKYWESTCASTVTKDIAEEETGNNDLGVGEILFGDCGEVSDVGKNVQDRRTTNGDGRGNFEGSVRILKFSEDVVGAFPSKVY